MYFTGFADEAAPGIDQQIEATLGLGWHNIEARNIDGKQIHDLSDEAFDVVYGKLQDAGVQINCFGSAIMNWGKKISSRRDYELDLEQTARAISRMKRLGTKMIRVMSYAVLPNQEADDQMIDERVRRMTEICKRFNDAGLTPVHENCMNYGGMGPHYTLELVERVPGLKLVFDTGNPTFTDNREMPKPHPKEDPFEFWKVVRDHVVYIHIKHGKWDAEKQAMNYSYPDENGAVQQRIFDDAAARGYDGGVSLEPHLGAVFHDPDAAKQTANTMGMYHEYGMRTMAMWKAAFEKVGRVFDPK